jgi:hypothetical protein
MSFLYLYWKKFITRLSQLQHASCFGSSKKHFYALALSMLYKTQANIRTNQNSFSSCTESEAIDRLNESIQGADEEEEEKVAGSEEPETSLAPGSVEYDESNSVGEEDAAVQDECRGDDKFRCGSTSTYICEVEKCDGVSNCPNGEDEENCPGNALAEGSGEEVDDNREEFDENHEEPTVDQTSREPEIEPIGDFFMIFMSFFFQFSRVLFL